MTGTDEHRVDSTARASIGSIAATSTRELLRSEFSAGVMFFMFLSLILILMLLDLLLPGPADGDSFLGQNIAIVPAMGYVSLALVGTAVPLVTYRDRGTLRLLGTTPLGRKNFLIGQMPVRAGIAAAEGIVVLALMWLTGSHSPAGLSYAAGTLVLGATMFLALGLLVGARGRNVDLTMQVSLIAPIIVIATSGVVPLDITPDWVHAAIDILPTTWFMSTLRGAEDLPPASIFASWTGLLIVAIGALALAVRIFDWGIEKQRA